MILRWQEIVVLPEVEEGVTCDCCGRAARVAEGRLLHREAPLARYTVRWRPTVSRHLARHVLYLGDWSGRRSNDAPAVAVAEYRGGPDGGFTLRDDVPRLLGSLARWRPRHITRADAIGLPLGDRLFAMLDAIHVKDPRLAELRDWALPE